MGQKIQIFISYSSLDKKQVEDILHKIEDLQIRIWKAPESIKPGSNYAREIPKAIRESALFLLFFSKNSQKSIWVEKEVDTAVSARVRIIPIQLDESPMSDMYHFYLNNVQMIPLYPDCVNAIQELRQQIHDMIVRENVQENAVGAMQAGELVKKSTEAAYIEKMTKKLADQSADNDNKRDKTEFVQPKISPKLIKVNELRKNKIPLYCEACGCTKLNHTTLGVYTCTQCEHENYDDYTKIRNYIKTAGPSTVYEISKQTGVTRDRINTYIKEGDSDSIDSSPRVCQVCGNSILSGNLCGICISRGRKSGLEEGKRFHIIRNK